MNNNNVIKSEVIVNNLTKFTNSSGMKTGSRRSNLNYFVTMLH